PRGNLRARADDRGQPLDRRRDRDGLRRRLLLAGGGGHRADGVRALAAACSGLLLARTLPAARAAARRRAEGRLASQGPARRLAGPAPDRGRGPTRPARRHARARDSGRGVARDEPFRPRRRDRSPLAPVAKAVLASQNAHKLEELREGLPGWQLDALAADDWPAETGETYEENARIKARFGRALAPTDVWVLGEDSGIESDALDGAPGLHSARWAPQGDQADALLERLAGEQNRRARMVTEIVALAPGGD